jgi:hypothetical protein
VAPTKGTWQRTTILGWGDALRTSTGVAMVVADQGEARRTVRGASGALSARSAGRSASVRHLGGAAYRAGGPTSRKSLAEPDADVGTST